MASDLGAVSGNTEFFNGEGWKRIDKYTEGEKVLQYNVNGTAELVVPSKYIHYRDNSPFYKHIGRFLCSCQTGSQDVVFRNKNDRILMIKQFEIVGGDFAGRVPLSFLYTGGSFTLDKKQLGVLAVALCYGYEFEVKGGVLSFSIMKDEEVQRIVNVLLDSEYTVGRSCVDTGFKIKLPGWIAIMLSRSVVGNFLYDLSYECRSYLVDALDRLGVQYIFANFDILGVVPRIPEVYKWLQFVYCSVGRNATVIAMPVKFVLELNTLPEDVYTPEYEEVYEEDKYSFSVPSWMLVLRSGERVYVTGDGNVGS